MLKKEEKTILEKKTLDALKGMDREERAEYFKKHKSDMMDDVLTTVNGGASEPVENPNSEEVPYKGNWISSFGYVCDGEEIC